MFFETGFPPDWSTHKKLIWMKAASGGSLPWQTFVGNPVQFNAPKAHTLRKTEVAFSPIQDLHGYANPWPAGGGANKWDGETESGRLNTQTGEPSATTPGKRSKNFIPVSPSTTYYVYSGGNINVFVLEYAEDGTFIRYVDWFKNGTYTTGATAYKIKFYTTTDSDYDKIAINYPSTVTTYSPYKNECPISGWNSIDVYDEPDYDPTAQPMTTLSFPSTVFGGTAEVAEDGTATGSKTWYGIICDSNTECSLASQTEDTAVVSIGIPYAGIAQHIISNRFSTAIGSGIPGRMVSQSWTVYLVIAKSELTSIDQTGFRKWFSEHETVLVYELATPQTITVTASDTPTAVNGINTMWTDGDTLIVEARGTAVS